MNARLYPRPRHSTALAFVAVTLGVTYWAARRSRSAGAYFAANRQIKARQNGIASQNYCSS